MSVLKRMARPRFAKEFEPVKNRIVKGYVYSKNTKHISFYKLVSSFNALQKRRYKDDILTYELEIHSYKLLELLKTLEIKTVGQCDPFSDEPYEFLQGNSGR